MNEQLEDAHEQRLAALGTRTPACSCGETNPFALTGAEPHVRCYECQAVGGGRSRVEQQHVAGQRNRHETVPMLGNDHRVHDAQKLTWPEATLRNLDSSPLLRAAACIRGWLDLLRVILDRTVGWVPAFLEHLHDWLVIRLGAGWWHDLDVDLGGTA